MLDYLQEEMAVAHDTEKIIATEEATRISVRFFEEDLEYINLEEFILQEETNNITERTTSIRNIDIENYGSTYCVYRSTMI